jgi:hypothetical protein
MGFTPPMSDAEARHCKEFASLQAGLAIEAAE